MKLGVLDFCPVLPGRPSSDALRQTIDLAVQVDGLGFSRFWLGEHHSVDVAHGSPETLVPIIAGLTSRLTVGPAGILLRLHSPLRVAKAFRLLGTLFPGRVDLGLGVGNVHPEVERAFALDARVAPAVHGEKVRELVGYLFPTSPETPVPPLDGTAPDVWLLGKGGRATAALAAELGTAFSVSLFFGQDDAEGALAHYRRIFERRQSSVGSRWNVAVAGVCADSDPAATRICREFMDVSRGDSPSLRPLIVGGPERCAEKLAGVARRYQTEEIVFLDLCRRAEDRRRCYQLLASAVSLVAVPAPVRSSASER